MIIDVTNYGAATLESAYYDCIIECNNAIDNGVITTLIESGNVEFVNEGFKDTIKSVIASVIKALRDFKNKIVNKFKEIKESLSEKAKKYVGKRLDQGISQVNDAFDKEKESIESLSNIDPDEYRNDYERIKKEAQKSADAIGKAASDFSKEFEQEFAARKKERKEREVEHKKKMDEMDAQFNKYKHTVDVAEKGFEALDPEEARELANKLNKATANIIKDTNSRYLDKDGSLDVSSPDGGKLHID